MKNHPLTLDEIQLLHQSGQLREAEKAYLAFLKLHPQDAVALHGLGMLYAEKGSLEDAQLYLYQASSLKPDEPSFALNAANVLKAQGLFGQAAHLLEEVIKLHPHYAAGFNNLGTIYFAQAKLEKAIEVYQLAIKLLPSYVDAYYNLGLALLKASRIEEAKHAFQAVLELTSEHVGADFQLGCLLMQQKNYHAAIQHFLSLQKNHPFHFETQSNLATCYLQIGFLLDAKKHYLKALEIKPKDMQVLYNLGVIAMAQYDWLLAHQYYERMLHIDPNHFQARNNLGVIFLKMKNNEKALEHFQAALKLQPNNEAIQHTLHILEGKRGITQTPVDYLKMLFDSYADQYDSHLLNSLKYNIPAIFSDILHTGSHFDDVLDLGCGTGLCGEIIREKSTTLTGVDLSQKMLALASKKKIYNELIEAEIVAFLQQNNKQYDLILAGDVLVYFGDLQPFFSLIASAMKPKGWFIFTAEISQDEDYFMTASGRFAHSQSYLDKLIKQQALIIRHYQTTALRTQEGKMIEGHVYLLEK